MRISAFFPMAGPRFLSAGLLLSTGLIYSPVAALGATGEASDWEITPLSLGSPALQLDVGGYAFASGFTADAPDSNNIDKTHVSGSATGEVALSHAFSERGNLSLNGSFYLYHDRYTADNYENDFTQLLYAGYQGDFGEVQLGMADGAAFSMAITGPVVNDETSPESHNSTFFPDPEGGVLIDTYALNSAVEASFNFAKLVYYTPDLSALSPALKGLRFGLSYAPSEGKDLLPFVSSGPKHTNRQKNITELAANYTFALGPMDIGMYAGGGAATRAKKDRTDTGAALRDVALGGEASLPLTDQAVLSFGGAYHYSNADAFCIDDVRDDQHSHSIHASAKLDYRGWSFGGEYSDGHARGATARGVRGHALAIGHQLNRNWSATIGWQQLHYRRSDGTFYNGENRIRVDALFLHLRLDISKS